MKQLVTWCGADISCNACQNFRCKMAQSFASQAAIDAAKERANLKKSIADKPGMTRSEKAYAVTMLRMVFPDCFLYDEEAKLLKLLGKND